MALIETLIQEGWLKTPSIIDAFQKIKREDFLTDELKKMAEINEALPIGSDQTISQPLVVAFMMEQLQPKFGEKILDIGSGSGWTTALLAQIVSGGVEEGGGKVIAVEILPELKKFGENNTEKYKFVEKGSAKFVLGDGSLGLPEEAPFDKILVSASATDVPMAWKQQLKVGGKIVAPIGSVIKTIFKKSETEYEEIEHPGFVFVPLISAK